ncbi:MAG: hypothetical protein A2026_16335 [Deltaproteobacteria bacterium RBG_19FT_COMBO_46_12]|nr:MAG: hypothetical protein A2026_16335 [Deltaproteobacteria bacterium RBG_19FT_COMBO_46_12]
MEELRYNRFRELVEGQKTFSVAQCICRKGQELLGKKCDRLQETCLGFGDLAQFYIENNWGEGLVKLKL